MKSIGLKGSMGLDTYIGRAAAKTRLYLGTLALGLGLYSAGATMQHQPTPNMVADTVPPTVIVDTLHPGGTLWGLVASYSGGTDAQIAKKAASVCKANSHLDQTDTKTVLHGQVVQQPGGIPCDNIPAYAIITLDSIAGSVQTEETESKSNSPAGLAGLVAAGLLYGATRSYKPTIEEAIAAYKKGDKKRAKRMLHEYCVAQHTDLEAVVADIYAGRYDTRENTLSVHELCDCAGYAKQELYAVLEKRNTPHRATLRQWSKQGRGAYVHSMKEQKTVRELAAELGVSASTIYRDLKL